MTWPLPFPSTIAQGRLGLRANGYLIRGSLGATGKLAAFLQRTEGLRRCGHQPAEAFLQQRLDIAGVHMRVAADNVVRLACGKDVIDGGGDLRVIVLAW